MTSQVTAPAATVDEDIIIIVDVVEIIAAVAIVVEAPDDGTVVALPSVVVVVVERAVCAPHWETDVWWWLLCWVAMAEIAQLTVQLSNYRGVCQYRGRDTSHINLVTGDPPSY